MKTIILCDTGYPQSIGHMIRMSPTKVIFCGIFKCGQVSIQAQYNGRSVKLVEKTEKFVHVTSDSPRNKWIYSAQMYSE